LRELDAFVPTSTELVDESLIVVRKSAGGERVTDGL
jgi:hypothetical protein